MRGRDQLVAQLTDDMKAALEVWVRSLSVEELQSISGLGPGEVRVDPDSILVYDPEKPQLDLELKRLRRIFVNISNHSHDVYEYLQTQPSNLDKTEGRKHVAALRKLATVRDSALEMSKLVNGEDLDEGDEPDDELTPSLIHELARIVPHDPFAPVEDDTLKLAQVHRQIRDLQNQIPNDHFTADGAALHGRINRITEYIRSK